MDEIIHKNQKYKIKNLLLENSLEVTISTVDLNDSLFDDQFDYISDEARSIDEMVLFYVENDVINLSTNELINYLNNNIV